MRTVTLIQVPMEQHDMRCDTPGCDYRSVQTTGIKGYTMRNGLNRCRVCDKDCCRNHSTYFQENPSSDHTDAVTCHACAPAFSEAWIWADQNAGRHDILLEVAERRLAEMSTDPASG